MITRLRALAAHVATILGSAMILLFFSEYFFLNEGPVATLLDQLAQSPGWALVGLAEFILFYALFTYIFLLALAWYQVKTVLGLFLAGALFGWATEGLVIAVVYEGPPVSFFFPSVGWHALVDVLVGWYGVRRVMRLRQPGVPLVVFVLLGLWWGGWATWFWGAPGPLPPIAPGDFARYVGVTSLLWLGGMLLLDQAGAAPWQPGRWETAIVLGIAAMLWLFTAAAFVPASLLLLPLLVLTVWAMRRAPAAAPDRLVPLTDQRPVWWMYPLALLTPLTAALTYPLWFASNTRVPTEAIVGGLWVGGVGLWLWGVVRAARQ